MKTIAFVDFNNTIEDIYLKRRGKKYFDAIKRLSNICKDELEIYIISKAKINLEDDVLDLLYFMPECQRKFYKGLIKNGGGSLTFFNHCKDGKIILQPPISLGGTTKLDGVELTRKIVDKYNQANLYIFIGDDKEADLPMIKANVKCKKYMVLANNRRFTPHIENVIKTSKHSYGVASAIHKICDEIEEYSENQK